MKLHVPPPVTVKNHKLRPGQHSDAYRARQVAHRDDVAGGTYGKQEDR